MRVARLYRFKARHHLPGVAGYDKPHEHEYTVEVVANGRGGSNGMVIDTQRLDDVMEPYVKELEGTNLNEIADPSTVENLAKAFRLRVEYAVTGEIALSVTVWEDNERWGQV